MNKSNSHKEHGTISSYVVGFIFSIVFTIIPYYMVVNKVFAGNALLTIILGFAVLQMFIQIFFFLHLGRGPKPLYNVVFFFGTAATIVVVVVASLFIMDNLYRNMSPREFILRISQKEGIAQVGEKETGACNERGENHVVVIKDDVVAPNHIEAKLCDTLTFINEDSQLRELAFGAHPAHESYGGEFEVELHQNEPETITLNEADSTFFHDHLEPSVFGHFEVE